MAQWIKPGINIDFVGHRRRFWILSVTAVVLSIGALVGNFIVRGDALHYGTDFKGGSQIQVELSKAVSIAEVRAALTKAGFKGAEVLEMKDPDRPHLVLLRLTQVSTFRKEDEARVKAALQKRFGGNVVKLEHQAGSDKVYITFKKGYRVGDRQSGADARAIDEVFDKTGVVAQQVQRFGRPDDNRYEVILGGLGEEVRRALETALGKGIVKDIPQVESVGARMGQQLRDDGIKSVLYALLLMLVYIAFRFDFRYAPGAVVALAHDVIITVGLFAITWTEFSLPVVAALLTIAGYSINDTIVVYDRIRENQARMRDRKFPLVVNASINETLSRTLLTSLTTLFTCVSIWLVGTGVLRVFAFALTAGVVVGTYSSVYVASPLVVVLNERFAGGGKKRRR